MIHAPGGLDIVSGDYTIAYLPPNSVAGQHVSDQSLKMNIKSINRQKILDKIVQIPVQEWRYKGQKYINHIGPMSQDFYSIFGYGVGDRFIQSVDIDGVILAGIQALGDQYLLFDNRYQDWIKTLNDFESKYEIMNASMNALDRSYEKVKQLDQLYDNELEALKFKEQKQAQRLDQLSQTIEKYQLLYGVGL